jgi:hypothetical protein
MATNRQTAVSRYTQRKDGECWEVKPGEIFKLACCDCGLVHQVVIVIEDGKVGIAAKRDARATGQRRRKHSRMNDQVEARRDKTPPQQ